jgi:hypothetical protein
MLVQRKIDGGGEGATWSMMEKEGKGRRISDDSVIKIEQSTESDRA